MKQIPADIATTAKAWPFEEARKLKVRTGGKTPDKGYVLFQTGYGPSGLPHIGTFGEVARTSMVRRAFEAVCPDIPTKLFSISDDLDGLRKVPTNLPEDGQKLLADYIGKPLSAIPDPFGTHESYAAHNNARLRAFLDGFGFQYDFKSSSDLYRDGVFDEALLKVLANFDAVMGVMLPTLGPDRRATYNPFMPISPTTGRVLATPLLEANVDAGTIVVEDEDGSKIEVPVTGGHCKLQWKPDWAMRKYQLGVDYEMYGKDLIDSAKVGDRLIKILGGRAPDGLTYELFLDGDGQKISKSKGNGLSMEDWLAYGPAESLAHFMYQKPKTAKRLFWDVIPKSTDEYQTFVGKLAAEEDPAKLAENPAWHIHGTTPPVGVSALPYSMLLNLASVANAENAEMMWGFISQYDASATPETQPFLSVLVARAVAYYQDFIKPNKAFRAPTEQEQTAFASLTKKLKAADVGTSGEDLQTLVYATGMENGYEGKLRDWFQALYQVLLGQDQGPRFGSFIALYGLEASITLLEEGAGGKLAA